MLRVVIVFVQFQDDTYDTPSCIAHPTTGWPSSSHAIPNWATGTKLVHSQANPPYTSGSMSDYYYVMSNGAFHFIGAVFPEVYLTPQPKSYYVADSSRGRGWLNQQIIDWMDNHSTYPVNFADYDNDSDGDVDMIIFIYRNWDDVLFNGIEYQGIADLGFSGSIVRDRKTIFGGFPGSGTSQNNVYTLADFREIVSHEIGHYQFGGDHFLYLGEFGIQDINEGALAMCGYERYFLNWITPTLIAADAPITITDAVTTSNYYRINIPNSDEYFLLENRQKLSIYELGDACLQLDLPATGLMIAHIRPSVTKSIRIH